MAKKKLHFLAPLQVIFSIPVKCNFYLKLFYNFFFLKGLSVCVISLAKHYISCTIHNLFSVEKNYALSFVGFSLVKVLSITIKYFLRFNRIPLSNSLLIRDEFIQHVSTIFIQMLFSYYLHTYG
jgi:hypothetical protein